MNDSAPERRRLAALPARNGVITSPWLRTAVEAVPRELFLHPGVFLDEGGAWRLVTAVGTDPAANLAEAKRILYPQAGEPPAPVPAPARKPLGAGTGRHRKPPAPGSNQR